jgi:dolichyl-phosphate beta-glucosyltransferase
MKKKTFLSVVIPCYNEEKNLRRGVLEGIDRYLKKQSYSSEVIISDDGSTDRSQKIVESFIKDYPRFRLLKNPHSGKPYAIKAGVIKAKGEIILFSDMDQSTPINEIEKLLPFFGKGFSVVIGSRGQRRTGYSLLRQVASNVFRLVRQALLLRKITDTQCGFKAFSNQAGKDLFRRLLIFKKGKKVKGWRVGAWDVELLFIAQKRGYKMAEVSVQWQDQDIAEGKERKFFRESQEMLKEILRVKINDLRGFYD